MKRTTKVSKIMLVGNLVTSIVIFGLLCFLIISSTGLKTKRIVYLTDDESMITVDENGGMEAYVERGFNFIPKNSTYSIWHKFIDVKCVDVSETQIVSNIQDAKIKFIND